ncbi:hypothetical protein JD969_09315 [Planctomycetota bacterium]|nr:hypothetical protein JD969_09315 [Planctomycetota bacterium]
MVKRIGKLKRRALIEDLVDAKHDLKELGERYNLQVDELAEWAGEGENARTLAGLCFLADMQTQLMLSRYRLLAADRLVRLATGDDGEASAEVSRKACVDLLKMDLKRADGGGVVRDVMEDGDGSGDEAKRELDIWDMGEMRRLLYGTPDGNGPNR